LGDYRRVADERLSDLDETTQEVAAGTARLQLRGLAPVAVGTLLTAVTGLPG